MIKYLWYKFLNLFSPVEVKVVEVKQVVSHLTESQYDQLVKRLPNCMLAPQDGAEVAAHKLGVALALGELRKGFTS